MQAVACTVDSRQWWWWQGSTLRKAVIVVVIYCSRSVRPPRPRGPATASAAAVSPLHHVLRRAHGTVLRRAMSPVAHTRTLPAGPGAITFHQRYKQVVIHRPGRRHRRAVGPPPAAAGRCDGRTDGCGDGVRSRPARVTAKNENLKRALAAAATPPPATSAAASPVFNARKGRSDDGRLLPAPSVASPAARQGGRGSPWDCVYSLFVINAIAPASLRLKTINASRVGGGGHAGLPLTPRRHALTTAPTRFSVYARYMSVHATCPSSRMKRVGNVRQDRACGI